MHKISTVCLLLVFHTIIYKAMEGIYIRTYVCECMCVYIYIYIHIFVHKILFWHIFTKMNLLSLVCTVNYGSAHRFYMSEGGFI